MADARTHASPASGSSSAPSRVAIPSAVSFLGYFAAVAIIIWSFSGAGWSFERLASGGAYLADFFARSWPPSVDRMDSIGLAMVETFQIALAGTVAGVIISVPVAILAAKGLVAGRIINTVTRTLLAFLRAVPDLVWALIFVIAVGLGPFAGMLAILVDTLGFCGRFFADDMENADRGPAEALEATGARRADIVACAIVPAAAPAMVSTSLFALEKAVRSSVVLGLVGAGGIGIELKVAFDLFDYQMALTIILMIAVVVVVVEQLGVWTRRSIIGDTA